MMKPYPSSAASVAALALALPAAADVIYSNLQDISIPATYDGVYLNVETGSWNTDMFNPVAGWDINPYFGGSTVWNSPSFQPVRSGTGQMDPVLNLGSGTNVDGTSVFSTFVQGPNGENPGGPGYGGSDTHLGINPGQFSAGDEGYLGFKLNGTNYGWMRVVFTNNTGGALIKDWAYDNSGTGIATGNVLQNGSTFTLNSAFGSFTLGSAITGSNSVVKSGSGTTTLAAASNYSGTTTVNGGTLALGVSGSIDETSGVALGGGTFDVSAKGVGGYALDNLTGTGTVLGSLTVSTGLAIGNSPGTVNFESLTLGALSTYTYELTGGAATADLGIVSDNLTIESTAILDLVQLGTYTLGNKYTLFAYQTGNLTGTFTGLGEGAYITDAGGQWQIKYSDTSAGLNGGTGDGMSYITITAIPEPRAALLGGLGLLMLLRRRR